MAIDQIINNRDARLNKLSRLDSRHSLLRYGEIDIDLLQLVQDTTNIFIKKCLTEFYKKPPLSDSDTLNETIKHKTYILNLPNLTPNGLLLPKQECSEEYNYFVRSVQNLASNILNYDNIEGIASPVNLRVSRGLNATRSILDRPTSSFKWHSDIWAGQNSNECMLHIPVAGDIKNNGINFALPNDNFINYVSHQENFDISDIRQDALNINMTIGSAYLVDSWLIHKTECYSEDLRLIVSFPMRVIPIESDCYFNSLRDDEYLTPQEWLSVGRTKFLKLQNTLEYKEYSTETKYFYAEKFIYD